ncbi:MAG TPA: PQQ-dependent sugar dehydrogenase, partial [Verrucomicrobiae bacterium]|nr:PQQ-dependent sugar dehydrogenase [Verrucomicrobiae bacterium]
PAVTTNYAVPPDNPFVGATNFNGLAVDSTKLRTEFYAVGLRNPWRMSQDPASGLLFVGDPGTSVFDEVNVITKGGNYGWPYREGTGPGPKSSSAPPGVKWSNPIYQRSAGAIIGGVVYRGQNYPQLQGAYVFGDYVAAQLLSLRYAGTNLAPAQSLTGQSGVAAFGVDPSNNDVLVVYRDGGKVLRLVYTTNLIGSPLPATLADTGAFADLGSLTPNPGIVGYDVNVPFWSDNAVKRRWFSLPGLSSTFGFSKDSPWSLPSGSIWIKHFELEMTNGVASSARRLETRFLVRTSTGIYGATYRWDDSQTNAVLVATEGLDEAFAINDGGTIRTQVWHYPGRNECLTCHTPLAGFALGFNTAQLNCEFNYPGGTQNQLRALSDAGYFGNGIVNFYTMPALAQSTNTAISVDYRVRSYLAANCVQCHQPGGAALGNFDARLTTPLSASGLLNGPLVNNLGDPANCVIKPGSLEHSVLYSRIANLGATHMPPLATSVLNQSAIDLVRDWISGSSSNYQSYADWQVSNFGSTSAPGSAPWEDPDGDGAVNQLEYLTSTDPLLAQDCWAVHC